MTKLYILIFTSGMVLLYGWVVGLPSLITLNLETFPPIKYVTAIGFIVIAVNLFILDSLVKTGKSTSRLFCVYLLSIITLLITILRMTFGNALGLGFESLLPLTDDMFKYSVTGLPSIGSTICFFIVAIQLVQFYFHYSLSKITNILYLFSGLTILGHIFNIPLLFFYFDGFSTGMSLYTAILFILTAYNFAAIKNKLDRHNGRIN